MLCDAAVSSLDTLKMVFLSWTDFSDLRAFIFLHMFRSARRYLLRCCAQT